MYSMEFSGESSAEDYWSTHKGSETMRENTMKLVSGVGERKLEIDSLINGASENWPLERMAVVDRNILRVASYELLECLDVPTAVVVDEALEIAKNYSSPDSVPFINGILGKIAKESRDQQ
jgi:N utilization substance protein B